MGWMRFSFSFYILVDVIDFLHFPCFFADQTSGPWWKFTDDPYPIHPSALSRSWGRVGKKLSEMTTRRVICGENPRGFLGGEESLMKRVTYVEWFEKFGFFSYQIFRAEGFWVKSCKSQCFLDKPRKIPRIRVLFVWHTRTEASVGNGRYVQKRHICKLTVHCITFEYLFTYSIYSVHLGKNTVYTYHIRYISFVGQLAVLNLELRSDLGDVTLLAFTFERGGRLFLGVGLERFPKLRKK